MHECIDHTRPSDATRLYNRGTITLISSLASHVKNGTVGSPLSSSICCGCGATHVTDHAAHARYRRAVSQYSHRVTQSHRVTTTLQFDSISVPRLPSSCTLPAHSYAPNIRWIRIPSCWACSPVVPLVTMLRLLLMLVLQVAVLMVVMVDNTRMMGCTGTHWSNPMVTIPTHCQRVAPCHHSHRPIWVMAGTRVAHTSGPHATITLRSNNNNQPTV